MKSSENGEEKATRQCWECLKRRLVCDHTLPHCKKCQKAGKECPGYDEQKPLQWVEPGKVTSRRRKKNSPPKIYTVQTKELSTRKKSDSPEELPLSESPESELHLTDPTKYEEAYSRWTVSKAWYWGDQRRNSDESAVHDFAHQNYNTTMAVDRIFAMGGRERIEQVVLNKDQKTAAEILNSDKNALKKLERLLRLMRLFDLPAYDYLTHETNEIVQSVHYYNVRILPSVKASGELAPNPAIINFPLNALYVLPPAIHHTLVCLSLNHFVHSLPIGTEKSVAIINRSKVYHHRGAAIRALSHYVGKDKTRCNDLTIASILMFMCMELQNPAMADWRSHTNGMRRLLDMRGGFKKILTEVPHMSSTLVIYVLIVVMANTCSPSWDQIELSGTLEQNIEDITAVYNLLFPYTLCPPALFLNVLKVNHLREKASAVLFTADMDPDDPLEAHDLLNNIESFSPEDWAQPGARYEEWLTIGTVYQSALAVYATMAFQSLTILPASFEMNSMRKVHGDRLLESLKKGFKSPGLNQFLLWPTTVMGVEAGYRDEATRYWVESQLSGLSRSMGTSSPLKAQAVLRRYWQKDEPGWDECFDRPYVFVI